MLDCYRSVRYCQGAIFENIPDAFIGQGGFLHIYLDFNASTPLAPEVASCMREVWEEPFGNPSSEMESELLHDFESVSKFMHRCEGSWRKNGCCIPEEWEPYAIPRSNARADSPKPGVPARPV